MSTHQIFSVGHSTHQLSDFLSLLENANISAIADVRSVPWSRHYPHFNRADLKKSLKQHSIEYRFCGKQLGGRPTNPALFDGSIADYEVMARTAEFAEGLDMVLAGAAKHNIALMCSEHDPLDCHRCLLVGRALSKRGVDMVHILSDGAIISQAQVETKLLAMSGQTTTDLFVSQDEQLNAAYRDRSLKVAYSGAKNDGYDNDEMADLKYG